ncbi:MAG: hypothetical protein ABI855_06465 [Bacteroidota bacterium]
MKKLIEMSQLVTDFVDVKTLKLLFNQNSYDPKAYLLLEGIVTGKYKDDAAASNDLYKSSPDIKKYLMLKSRTKEYLLNLIFTMNKGKRMKSPMEKALYVCSRNIIAARLLILRGMRNVAIDYLKTALTLAGKFQFTDLEILAARLLRMHESFAGTENKMIIYDKLIKNKNDLLIAEIKMEEFLERIYLQMRKTVSLKEKLLKTTSDSFKMSKEIIKKYNSHTLFANYYRITIYYYHNHGEHLNVIKACESCEKFLKSNSVFTDLVLVSEMALQKLDTSLYLRDYNLGKENASICRSLSNPGYINWIIFLEYYFLLCLHTQNYSEALKVFNEASNHPKFSTYPPERLEKWKIFEAFLFYIIPNNAKQKRFNVFKFVNEVPIYSKDKKGYNLSIIIAQISLLIKMGELDRAMDIINPLKIYSWRYVSKNKNPRSFYFVKMLSLLLKYDFNPEKTKGIANKFFIKIKQSKLGNQGELETLEVIPYDILWEDMMSKLVDHFKKIKENAGNPIRKKLK